MLTLRARGQTLPVWAFGIGIALVLAVAALQYGEILRWHIRAQNAADAAAAAALSVQSSAWNQQLAAVYAASVEEYRLRTLLAGMIVANNDDLSCRSAAGGCAQTYANLKDAYLRSLARYNADVELVHRSSQYTLATAVSDARAIVGGFQAQCGAGGGDCAFAYSVHQIGKRAGTLNQVLLGANAWAVNYGSEIAAPKDDYTPLQIEVVTCATVPPLLPSIMGWSFPSFTAIGRAAATSAMVTQEWIDPGTIVNPATSSPFQPVESGYEPAGVNPSYPSWHDWFRVQFGGNPATAYPSSDQYTENQASQPQPEFTAITGWWSTIPIPPYGPALDLASTPCKGS